MYYIVYAQKNIWFFCLFPILAIIFFICILAETNRAPFDLPEAEGEIVAGYNLEYGSMTFALFFLGEYCNIYAMSALFSILFLGGWGWPLKLFYINNLGFALAVKTIFICYLFILVRANLPRYRFDQLLYLGWKIFIPIGLGYSVFTGGLLLDINFINFYIPKEIFFEMNHILQNSFNI